MKLCAAAPLRISASPAILTGVFRACGRNSQASGMTVMVLRSR